MHISNTLKAITLLLATSALAQDDNNNNGESDRDSGNTGVVVSASTTSTSAAATSLASTSTSTSASGSSTISSSTTTSTGASQTSSTVSLKLAKKYVGQDFMNEFDYFTDDDPTSGYVNYVSKSEAQKSGLIDVQANNVFYMAADSTNVPTGRGRDSIRISSKSKYADGVYILDLNHMPVGCGTWPAWWTVTKSGWPKGGEIDILEGANGLATNPNPMIYNAAALHTSDTCALNGQTYMNGQIGEWQCSAYFSGNTGCGVKMTGVEGGSYGGPVNGAGGGWYAMWRDLENSGGIYVWFWPRTSTSVPDDVKNPNTATTNVANWGIPNANMTVPCRDNFNNHVIVFDLTFCGDYAGATYASSGCPGSCATFVRSNPAAYSEAYWSLNSLRVYTASGKAASSGALSKGAIAGIVVGVVAGLVILFLLYLRFKKTRKNRHMVEEATLTEEPIPPTAKGPYAFLAARKPRIGPTTLAPGRTAQHFLDGETPTAVYGRTPKGSDSDIKLAEATYRPHGGNSSWIG
ncbi:hypothetical protein I302_105704 [Kwoniella bestiolae CBS 10118]|uniref:GH16 domain-containing protein n=1 Tax=Kwoniella bestiolae CBS 10118 TaxID=1296100 RepID=A0A1B9G1W6_9TREE|nr:hypothetical protein I302_04824 [Kwoniella bestiolae CBS 10118]OCF25014.1 hypothetical protein I302_04824 [Kwoniella bestiolae CBS 10118]